MCLQSLMDWLEVQYQGDMLQIQKLITLSWASFILWNSYPLSIPVSELASCA